MTETKHWRSFPFLQALRPEPGEVVEAALLTTYSADLVVVAASLLALAGLDDDRGSGSKVDFANAFERLNGRFRVLCQCGRVLEPIRNTLVLNLMDRFVREVRTAESTSWHQKAALVRYLREDGSSSWRVWVGSRNLTRSAAWEFGMVLVSSAAEGQKIPGIGALAESLASHAGLDTFKKDRVGRELDRLQWKTPRGIRVEELGFWQPGQMRELPDPPARLKRLIVVSPFLDGSIIGKLGKWGDADTERILVSTLPELQKLAPQVQQPLAGFKNNLRYVDAPVEDEVEADAEIAAGGADEEQESRGLHAKLVFAEHAAGRTLWVGSANATQRGWLGPNSEIIVRLSADSEIADGLNAFINSETCDVYEDLLKPVESDPDDEEMESTRNSLAASWNLRQEVDGGVYWLCGDYDPYDVAGEMEIRAGRLGGVLEVWPRGSLRLPLPPTSPASITEFVVISLRLGENECRWVQVALIAGFNAEDRDKTLMAQYLDLRTFLSWVRSLLQDSIAGEGGGDWNEDRNRRTSTQKRNDADLWAPTLEQALKAWVRDPEQLQRADCALARYFDTIRTAQEHTLSAEEVQAVSAVRKVWPVIRRELVQGRRGTGGSR
jgi:HKD family nuclease